MESENNSEEDKTTEFYDEELDISDLLDQAKSSLSLSHQPKFELFK